MQQLFFPEQLFSYETSLSFHSPAALRHLRPEPALPRKRFFLYSVTGSLRLGQLLAHAYHAAARAPAQRGHKGAGNKRDPGREGQAGERLPALPQPRLLRNSAAVPGFLVSLHISTAY